MLLRRRKFRCLKRGKLSFFILVHKPRSHIREKLCGATLTAVFTLECQVASYTCGPHRKRRVMLACYTVLAYKSFSLTVRTTARSVLLSSVSYPFMHTSVPERTFKCAQV